MSKEYAYSEIFFSTQGEGKYTGVPTAWLRFFLCNLQCDGFGQLDPTNPETYVLPYKDLDVSKYKSMEELPVFNYGCDSSYSWSKKYKHLAHRANPEQLADKIIDSMKNQYNTEGTFQHPTGLENHLCFTGGEPLMSHAQECSVGILRSMIEKNNYPLFVTYETNGTQELSEEFEDFWTNEFFDTELFFSISPKLFTVSGEHQSKAIKPEVVKQYWNLSKQGQLKFVINGSKESWEELESVINQYRAIGVEYPVYIMPVGATIEGQELTAGDVAREAFQRGYNVSARVHVYLWGNTIGV